MKTLVLSLPRATDRRAAIAQRLETLGLTWELVDGLLGKDLRDADSRLCASPLSHGELGCYFGHMKAWQRVLARGDEAALIVEDDVIFDPSLLQVLADLTPVLPSCDLIRLSSLQKQVGWDLGPIGRSSRLVLPTKNPSGTQAYIVTRSGAKKLLRWCECRVPLIPIDSELDAHWRHGWRSFVLVPPVAWEDRTVHSMISGDGRLQRSTRLSFVNKIQRSLAKRLALLQMYRQVRRHRPGLPVLPREVRRSFTLAPRNSAKQG